MAVIVASSTLVLGLLAARADTRAIGGRPVLTVLDLAVGFAFALAALAAGGPQRERFLVGAIGLAWLAGSLSASALSLHQGALAVALLAFPGGKIRGALRLPLVVGAVLVAFELVPQLGVAALFGAIAAVSLAGADRSLIAKAYPAGAAFAVAAALGFAWWSAHRGDAFSPQRVYEITLIAIAVGFPIATRVVIRSRARLADRVLGDSRLVGVPGLQLVLSGVVGDPGLRIDLWDEQTGAYVEANATEPGVLQSETQLQVLDGDQLVARVITTSRAVADGPTAEAICNAVRLVAVNHRLRARQTQRLVELEASRARLVAAADRERERISNQLRTQAGALLQQARGELAAARSASNAELSELIDFAASEVAAVAEEMQRIVAGAAPVALGEGRLAEAITALAVASPAHVTLTIADDTAARPAVETTLFYVCSEALANVSKHSGATHVAVDMQRKGSQLELLVRDDGTGGADATGLGLQGLSDRLATLGGHLDVRSPVDGGTVIGALVPLP